MNHRNAPLTPAGRLRLIERCQHRPIAHVAAEAGVSRQCLSIWKDRYQRLGEAGLQDRSSAPKTHPTPTSPQVIARIEELRRTKKWSARTITSEFAGEGITVSESTVARWLRKLGISRRRDLDFSGASNRKPAQKIIARYPGHMIHPSSVDVKKVGRIPDGGGWRAHGRGSAQHKASRRAAARPHAQAANKGVRTGYVFLHTAIDGYSRLAYTEHLPDEKAFTAITFMNRARAWFAAHAITRITRVVTDNGSCYRAASFVRALNNLGVSVHQRIRPFTPRHNGKVERYNRILAEEFLYARLWTSETQRAEALRTWNVHYNYHRNHTAAGNQPPAQRLRTGVTNVMTGTT